MTPGRWERYEPFWHWWLRWHYTQRWVARARRWGPGVVVTAAEPAWPMPMPGRIQGQIFPRV